MKIKEQIYKHPNISCFLFIVLGFFLTSAGYLSWVHHLIGLVQTGLVEYYALVLGYLVQAMGIGLFSLLSRKKKERAEQPSFFIAVVLLFMVCLIPATLSRFAAGALIFGYLMNLFCGVISAFYLYALAFKTVGEHNGVIFGGAYGAATVAAWLLSTPWRDNFLKSAYVLIIYVVLAVLLVLMFYLQREPERSKEETTEQNHKTIIKTELAALTRRYLLIAAGMIVLFNLVKNLGFSFPSSDVTSGISIELSRLFYAAGLVIAGLINDKSRKYGAICVLAGLVLPFVMLALSGVPVSGMIFWALEYFFFGFFSVYRVIFFSDLSRKHNRWTLAGVGFLLGHVGDALGTGGSLLLQGHLVILVVITVVLFFATVLLFFLIYPQTYGPQAEREKSERELFEQFSSVYDLSAREREVLRLIVDEKTNSEIADVLVVSESTVKFHVRNLLKKTDCKNRIELLSKYVSEAK